MAETDHYLSSAGDFCPCDEAEASAAGTDSRGVDQRKPGYPDCQGGILYVSFVSRPQLMELVEKLAK